VRFVRTSAERSENVIDGNADMNAPRKSDGFVVPATPANNGGPRARGVGRGKGPSQEERLTGDHRAGLSAGPNAGQTARATCVKVFVPSTFTFDLRQEPYEVILHVRICAGGRRQRRSLPRYDDRRRSKEAGFDLHLVKPVDSAEVVRLLAERKA
jgi:hypothetical protein